MKLGCSEYVGSSFHSVVKLNLCHKATKLSLVANSTIRIIYSILDTFWQHKHLIVLLFNITASTMRQVCFFLVLSIMLVSAPPVVCSFTKDESAEIGTCRFDLTSLATLSCLQPDKKKWTTPSATCCKALLHAIDESPSTSSEERGACCLCRYIF